MEPSIAGVAAGAARNTAASVVARGTREWLYARVVGFLTSVSESVDPGKVVSDLITEIARDYANTVALGREEDFFAECQNIAVGQESEVSAQRVVSCIMAQVRSAIVHRSTLQDIGDRGTAVLSSRSVFAMSLENLFHLSVLSNFKQIIGEKPRSKVIAELKSLKEKLDTAIEKVHTHPIHGIEDKSADFELGLGQISKTIEAHIEQLEVREQVEPIVGSMNAILTDAKTIAKGLVRVLQHLHVPDRNFAALDIVSPGTEFSNGLSRTTYDVLKQIIETPSGRSLLEIDNPIFDGQDLMVLSLSQEKIKDGLSSVPEAHQHDFAGIIIEAYTLHQELKRIMRLHEEMTRSAYDFGEIMLAKQEMLRCSMETQLQLIEKILDRVSGLYEKIGRAVHGANRFKGLHTEFGRTEAQLLKCKSRMQEKCKSIRDKLNILQNRKYVSSVLKRYIDSAIEAEKMLMKLGGTVDPSQLSRLEAIQRTLNDPRCAHGLVDISQAYIQIETLSMDDFLHSATPEKVIVNIKEKEADAAASPSVISQDAILKAELLSILFKEEGHFNIIKEAYAPTSRGTWKSKKAIEAKTALRQFIQETQNIEPKDKNLTKESFANCTIPELEELKTRLCKICSFSKQQKKLILGAKLEGAWKGAWSVYDHMKGEIISLSDKLRVEISKSSTLNASTAEAPSVVEASPTGGGVFLPPLNISASPGRTSPVSPIPFAEAYHGVNLSKPANTEAVFETALNA